MFFIHFWANDDAVKLARGVRAALDKTAVAQHSLPGPDLRAAFSGGSFLQVQSFDLSAGAPRH